MVMVETSGENGFMEEPTLPVAGDGGPKKAQPSEHGWRPDSHEVLSTSARRSTGQGVKPITEGFSPTL